MNKVVSSSAFSKAPAWLGHLQANTRSFGENAAYLAVKDSGGLARTAGRRQAQLLQFNSLFPEVLRDLTENSDQYYDIRDANKWLAKVLEYNMTGGRNSRGIAVVESYKILTGTTDGKLLRRAQILGWCLELNSGNAEVGEEEAMYNLFEGQSPACTFITNPGDYSVLYTSVVLTQDMIDEAKMRRGRQSWYLQVNGKYDFAPRLIEAAAYKLLSYHFEKEPYYTTLLQLFHNVSSKVMMGQALDTETRADTSLSQFTMVRYATIAKYKTSYISFKLPVALAMAMAGIEDPEVYRQSKTILLEMGHFYQAKMDFINCYGSRMPPIEPRTDIEDGKCTWLAVVALQRISTAQKKIFVECYGKKDEEKGKIVKEIYSAVGIRSTYKRFEEHSYELLCTQIQQVSRGLPHHLFLRFLKAMPGFAN